MSLKNKEMTNHHTTPDSTTKEKMQFAIGDEVLLQRKDGNFYLGTVVEMDRVKEMCLVKFGDNTQSWSTVARLTKLSTGFDVMCVKCKSSQSKKDNDILVCDRCSRGYHQLCHSPTVKSENLSEGNKWECCRCEELPDKRYLPLRKSSSTLVQVPPTQPPPPEITKLPYKIGELEWDVQHRVNKSNKYCYCGNGGKWFLRMLQCGRCRQWFHTKCISSLNCPIFFGDRFFVFVCSVCNNGKEFVRRLEMKWVDVIHLTIFHLTLISSKKYLHVDNDIVKFMNSNWKKLQLPKIMEGTDISDRKDKVLNILTGNRNRFKNCREVAKRTTMWGLRIRVPPPPPAFNLPPNKPLTDTILTDAFSNNPRLKFLIVSVCTGGIIDSEWDGKEDDSLPGIPLLHLDKNPIVLSNGVTPTGHNVCIKSSAPRSEIERRMKSSNDFRSRKARKLLRKAMTKNKNGKVGELPPTPPSSESNPEHGGGGGGAGMDTSGPEDSRPASPCTLDAFIPPPTDFEGSNNPFHSFPLSLAPTQRIVPTKRRLSEKDIRITSNGEVKRRRVRRRKLAADPRMIPRHTPTTSPVKTPPPISLQQLKTSVNHFFGAINRIAAGEKFKVRAKRVSSDGKVQYLIDWGGSPT